MTVTESRKGVTNVTEMVTSHGSHKSQSQHVAKKSVDK